MRKILASQWQWLLSGLFAVSVFCFWGYARPAIVLERESLQLFLWNGNYFLDRIAVPGGLVRYVAEFLVQFFRLITYGAIIYALLLTAIQRLTWKVLCRSFPLRQKAIWLFLLSFVPAVVLWYLACDIDFPTTLPVAVCMVLMMMAWLPEKGKIAILAAAVMIPVGYWLAGPIVVFLALMPLLSLWKSGKKTAGWLTSAALVLLLIACVVVSSRIVPYPLKMIATGIDYRLNQPHRIGDYDEMEYDYLQRRMAWQEMVEFSRKHPPRTLACENALRLAKWRVGLIGEEELKENMRSTHKVLTGCVAALTASDTYMSMGFVNLAQRASSEVLEGTPNYNKSGRVLERLTEICIITRQYKLAEKYISLLKQTLFYRNGAQAMEFLLKHPEQIKNNPFFEQMQQRYDATEDVLFI